MVFAGKFLNRFLGFLGVVYFTNVLGASGYGIYVLFVSVAGVLTLFTDMGIRTAVEKRVSEGQDDVLLTSLALKLPLVAVLLLAISLKAGWINSYIGQRVAKLLVPAVLLTEFGRLLLRKLSGELRLVERTATEVFRNILFLGCSVGLIHTGLEAKGLIIGYVFSWAAAIGLLLFRVSVPLATPSMSTARSLISFAKYNFFATLVSNQVTRRMDVLVIGFFLSSFHVGAYQVAWQVSGIVVLFSSSVGNVIFPHISSLYSDQMYDSIKRVTRNAFTGALFFTCPAIFGLLFLREQLLSLVFGSDMVAASAALGVLLIGRLSQSLNDVSGRLLMGVDRPDLVAISSSVLVVTNMVLNVVLVWQFEMVGAAAATATALVVNFALVLYFSASVVPVDIDIRAGMVILLASTAMYVGLFLAQMYVPITTLAELLLFVAFGGLMYFALVILDGQFRNRFLKFAARYKST